MYDNLLNQIKIKTIKKKFPEVDLLSEEDYTEMSEVIDANSVDLSTTEYAKLITLVYSLRNK